MLPASATDSATFWPWVLMTWARSRDPAELAARCACSAAKPARSGEIDFRVLFLSDLFESRELRGPVLSMHQRKRRCDNDFLEFGRLDSQFARAMRTSRDATSRQRRARGRAR
eukprot:3921287-Pyramimonas_sp.AAC.1